MRMKRVAYDLGLPFDQFHDTIRFFVPQHRRQLVQSSDLMGCRSNPVPEAGSKLRHHLSRFERG